MSSGITGNDTANIMYFFYPANILLSKQVKFTNTTFLENELKNI
jgi:hypothetical protein